MEMTPVLTRTWSVIFVCIAFLLHVSFSLNELKYAKLKNTVTDGIATRSSSTTRNAVSCAIACFTQSNEQGCTIAVYNKTSKNCLLTTSSVASLIYSDAEDTFTLLPLSDCDSNALPAAVNGQYAANPSFPGSFFLSCDDDYVLSLTNEINSFYCDVNNKWLSSNVTCLPQAYTKFAEGREFITAFMENYGMPDVHLRLYVIASENNTTFQYSTLTINAPKSAFNKTYTIDKYLELDITSDIEINDTIFITSQRPVTVFAMNVNSYSTGGMLVLPTQSLASTYLVATTPYDDQLSSLMIISKEDDTSVTLNFPDKTSQTVNVKYGDTYQLVKSGLSGTFIEADKDIAVFAGEKCANLPDPGNYSCDHIIEQMPPFEALDTMYIAARTEPRTNFGLLIVAANDSTFVYINDINSMTLYSALMHRHDTLYQTFGQNIPYVSVAADKPVLVTQYGVSTSVDNIGQGDASMFVVPGVNHFLRNYRFVAPDGYVTNKVILFYNITDGSDPRSGLKHNGVVEYVAEMTSVIVSYYTFGVCYLEVAAGVHYLENSVAFGAILYGQARYKEYAWNLGMYMWRA